MSGKIFYRDRANQYAPKTLAEIERAARELAAQGFSDHTVSAILRLDLNTVRRIVGQRSA